MWFSWPTFEAFEAWHDSVCAWLGLPKPGRNVATREIDLDAEWTTAYTGVVQVSAGDWRGFVEPDVAAAHPDGLGVPCDPPSFPDIEP